jgi:hypothetical protein
MPVVVGNLISGGLASFMSTTIGKNAPVLFRSNSILAVPVDVISQRQMIQGTGYHLSNLRYAGARDAFRSILKAEGSRLFMEILLICLGIQGLYRGYGASILTYTPSSALWWSTYSIYKKQFLFYIPHNPVLDGLIVIVSGTLAGTSFPPFCRGTLLPSLTRFSSFQLSQQEP